MLDVVFWGLWFLCHGLLFMFFLFGFPRHCHKFLCSDSLSVGQESGSCESAFLSVRGVKLVYKQVKRKIPADSTMCNPTRRAGMQFALAPEDMPILVPASGASCFLFSAQEVACSTVCAAGCHELFVQASNLKLTQEFSSGILCFGLGSSCFHCMLVMGG